jgi:prepilin-type N-terminal cleavage/methylation domain-containing protein
MHLQRHHTSHQGFTLIELLVVIAIISVLSSIVLVSLSSARGKGNDASIKANLATISLQASYYNNEAGYYAQDEFTTCDLSYGPGSNIMQDRIINQAMNVAMIASPEPNATMCGVSPTGYAIAVQRPSGYPSKYWCIDSEGAKCGNEDGLNPGFSGGANTSCAQCTDYQ